MWILWSFLEGETKYPWLTPNLWTETVSPVEELEKGPKELKRFVVRQEEQEYESNQYTQSSQGLNHKPKSTH